MPPRKLTMPLSEYKSHMETDTGRRMIKEEGITPEMVKPEKPSGGFLGHLKEKAGQVLDRVTRPKRLIDIGQKARSLGANMRYLADMNKESSTDRGGMTVEKMGRLTGERKKRMEE